MKKLSLYAPIAVTLCGLLGAMLRNMVLSSGPDGKGLYPAGHPCWILLLILTAAVLAGIWLLTKFVPSETRSHPPVFTAVGAFAAAVGMAHFGLTQLGSTVTKIACLAALCGAAAMLLLGVFTLLGKKGPGIFHLFPTFFSALLMFVFAQSYSREPELSRFCLQLGALAFSTLAFFQKWGWETGLKDEKKTRFWTLSALYLCLIAAPGSYSLLFSGMALYHLLGNIPEENHE